MSGGKTREVRPSKRAIFQAAVGNTKEWLDGIREEEWSSAIPERFVPFPFALTIDRGQELGGVPQLTFTIGCRPVDQHGYLSGMAFDIEGFCGYEGYGNLQHATITSEGDVDYRQMVEAILCYLDEELAKHDLSLWDWNDLENEN